MEIIDIKPRGFCKGVASSLRLAKQTRKKYPETKITLLGPLVHNHYITQALNSHKITTLYDPSKSRLQLIDEIDEGIVIMSAHGTADEVIKKAENKGLMVINAICEDVVKVHDLIRESIKNQYQIIYIGKENHPESVAIMTNFPVHFVSSVDDINTLEIASDKIVVTNQTTLSILQLQEIYDAIIEKYPFANIENDICWATTLRQEAVIKSHNQLDVLIVVGDPMSHNTSMLAKTGKDYGISVVMKIGSIQELDTTQLKPSQRIGITSGASTPHSIQIR